MPNPEETVRRLLERHINERRLIDVELRGLRDENEDVKERNLLLMEANRVLTDRLRSLTEGKGEEPS